MSALISEAMIQWVVDYINRNNGHIHDRCSDATREMVEAFPELRRVAGFVSFGDLEDGELGIEHFWCVAPDGSVIDPTALQFGPPDTEIRYREFQPGDEIRVGKCMNCGDNIYRAVRVISDPENRRDICSTECERAFADYLERDQKTWPGYLGK